MQDCEFKTTMPDNVFRGATWIDYVKTFKEPCISAMKLKRIQWRLEQEILEKSLKTQRQHVKNLQQAKADMDRESLLKWMFIGGITAYNTLCDLKFFCYDARQ